MELRILLWLGKLKTTQILKVVRLKFPGESRSVPSIPATWEGAHIAHSQKLLGISSSALFAVLKGRPSFFLSGDILTLPGRSLWLTFPSQLLLLYTTYQIEHQKAYEGPKIDQIHDPSNLEPCI